MPRKSAKGVELDLNIRAIRIYPTKETRKDLPKLKTVGIKLSSEEARHLAQLLLVMAEEHKEIDITGYRLEPRKSDDTYHVTVTGMSR